MIWSITDYIYIYKFGIKLDVSLQKCRNQDIPLDRIWIWHIPTHILKIFLQMPNILKFPSLHAVTTPVNIMLVWWIIFNQCFNAGLKLWEMAGGPCCLAAWLLNGKESHQCYKTHCFEMFAGFWLKLWNEQFCRLSQADQTDRYFCDFKYSRNTWVKAHDIWREASRVR